MEGKKSRLKRKPKVSPVPSKDGDSLPVQRTGGRPEDQNKVTEVIVIDEASPPAPTLTTTTMQSTDRAKEARDSSSTEESSSSGGPWRGLVDALLAINQQCKRLPLQTLVDLPAYQAAEVRQRKETAAVPPVPKTDLMPLPKVCPSCLLHKRKKTVPPPAQHITAVPQTELPTAAPSEKLVPTLPRMTPTADVHPAQTINPVLGDLATARTQVTCESVDSDQSEIISKSKQRVPVPFKPTAGTQPVRCKPSLSGSGLFSRFSSSMQGISDDVDEFEDPPTVSNIKTGREKSVGGKPIARKRPSESLDSSNVSKKARSANPSVGVKQTPVTKSLFPSQTKPLSSKAKSNPGEKSQTLMSSFSARMSTSSLNRVSINKNLEESSLGNTSVCTSRGSQQGKFLDARLSANANVRHSVVPGLSKDSAAEDASALPLRGSVPRPARDSQVTAAPPRSGESIGRGQARGDKGKGGGGGLVSGSPSERVKLCPLCQTTFSSAMSSLDIDAHIAACLSVVDDDDIVW